MQNTATHLCIFFSKPLKLCKHSDTVVHYVERRFHNITTQLSEKNSNTMCVNISCDLQPVTNHEGGIVKKI